MSDSQKSMAMEAFGRLLSTNEAGQYLGLSHRTLEDWRLRGGGPLFRKFGKRIVRYLECDLVAFVQGAARANTGCVSAPG